MTRYQRKVLFSTASGIALENMDIMFLSFSLSSIISTFGLSGTQAGLIATITNLGMLIGGIFLDLSQINMDELKYFPKQYSYFH